MSQINPLLAGSGVNPASGGTTSSVQSASSGQRPTEARAQQTVERLMPGIMAAASDGPPPMGVPPSIWQQDLRSLRPDERASTLRVMSNELSNLARHAMLKNDEMHMRLLHHIGTCKNSDCSVPKCTFARKLLSHYRSCTTRPCAVCCATREHALKLHSLQQSQRDNASKLAASNAMLQQRVAGIAASGPAAPISAPAPAPAPHASVPASAAQDGKMDDALRAAMAIVNGGFSLGALASAGPRVSSGMSAQALPTTSAAASGPLHPTALRQSASHAGHAPVHHASSAVHISAIESFAAGLVAAAGSAPGAAAPQRPHSSPVSTGGFSAFAQASARPQSLRLSSSHAAESSPPAAAAPAPAPAAPSTPKINEQYQSLAALSRFQPPPAAPQVEESSDQPKKVVQNKLDPHYCQLYQFSLEELQQHKHRLRTDFNPLYPPARIKAVFKPLVKRLMEKDENAFFSVPVDPVLHACPDYLQVIKRPMDLGTVSKKLDRSEYRTVESLYRDVMQIWRNAKIYNPAGHGVHTAAQGMELSAQRLMRIEIDKMADLAKKRQRLPDMNVCSLCEGSTMTYEPPTIFCNACDRRVKKDSYYYTDKLHRYHWCTSCFRDSKDPIKMEDRMFDKDELSRKKHDNHGEEPWVCCDQCKRWQHQVCALFNGSRGNAASETGVDMQYYCCDCMISALHSRKVKGAATRLRIPSADEIETHSLDVRIQNQVNAVLARKWQEQQEKARRVNTVPGAAAPEIPEDLAGPPPQIILRMMSCNTREYGVGPEFLKRYGGPPQEGGRNYPKTLPYRSKSLYMFQNIDGVDVLLFAMYVQEYDEFCPAPNNRTAYLAYLDSVKFFTVPWLRTDLYKEVLIAYMADLRRRGFNQMLIWACPPKEGDDYILFCHPVEQRTPKDRRLQKWYLDILRDAHLRNIVHRVVHLADDYFPSLVGTEGGRDRDVYELPNYEGDYWPRQAEDESKPLRLEAEEDGEPLLPGMKPASAIADSPVGEVPSESATDVAASKLASRKQGMVLSVQLALSLAAARNGSGPARSGAPIPMPPPAYARRSAVLLHRASAEVKAAVDARREALFAVWQAGKSSKGAEMVTRAKSKGDKAKKKRGKVPKGKAKGKGPAIGVTDTPLRDDPLRHKVFGLLTQSPTMHSGFFVAKLRPSCQVYKTYIMPNERYYSYTGLNHELSKANDPKMQKGNRDLFKSFLGDQLYVVDLSIKAWQLPDAELKKALGKHPLAARFNRQDWTPNQEGIAHANVVDQQLLKRLGVLQNASNFFRDRMPEYKQLSAQLKLLIPVCHHREAATKKAAGQDVVVPPLPPNSEGFVSMPLEELIAKVSGMRERHRKLGATLERARLGNLQKHRSTIPDPDKDVDRRFFGTRQLFLDLCRGNHYQFDQLRRAKHSSMMLLYHIFNVNAPSYVYHCNECGTAIMRDEEHGLEGIRWSCTQCDEYDICDKCKQSSKHAHLLVPFSTIGTLADMNEGNDRTLVGEQLDRSVGLPKLDPPATEATPQASPTADTPVAPSGKTTEDKAAAATEDAQAKALESCSRALLLLKHAPTCSDVSCSETGCGTMKQRIAEFKAQVHASAASMGSAGAADADEDDFGTSGSSPMLLAMWNLVKLHTLQCQADPHIGSCKVPFCSTLKIARERRHEVALRAIRGSVARRGGEAMGGTATAGDAPDDAPQATEAEKAKGAKDKTAKMAKSAGMSKLVIPDNVIAKVRNVLRECPQLASLPAGSVSKMAKWAAHFDGKVSQHTSSTEAVALQERLQAAKSDPASARRYRDKLAALIERLAKTKVDLTAMKSQVLDIYIKAVIYSEVVIHPQRQKEKEAAAAAASVPASAPQPTVAADSSAGQAVFPSAATQDRVGGTKRKLDGPDTSLASASKKVASTPFGVPLKASAAAAMGAGSHGSAFLRTSAQVKLDAASRVPHDGRSRDRSASPPTKRAAQ